jgi:hypothetical protein
MGVIERVVMCAVAVALTIASLIHKLPCTVPPPPGVAVITQYTKTACFSDIAPLFSSRGLITHAFPYVHAPLTDTPGALPAGTTEYPTLTSIWAWLSALPVASGHGFIIVTALTFIPVVVLITLLLQAVAGRRAWIWAATPPLFLYAVYNWDVLPTICTAAGIAVVLVGPRRLSPFWVATLAGAAFGLGAAFKVYPAMFVAPLAAAYLVDARLAVRARLRLAAATIGAAVLVLLLANVPFILLNYSGWRAVIAFQATRTIGSNTLSIWYWWLQPYSAQGGPAFQATLNHTAAVATAIGVLLALAVGIVIGLRRGTMPWVQTSAAMLCAYIVLNKVDSPQYVLWLLPFFVVVRLRLGWVAAYLAADLATFVGWYHNIYLHSIGIVVTTWADNLLVVGVWGRAILLFVLAGVFLTSALTPSATVRHTPGDRVVDPGSPDAAVAAPRPETGAEDGRPAAPTDEVPSAATVAG